MALAPTLIESPATLLDLRHATFDSNGDACCDWCGKGAETLLKFGERLHPMGPVYWSPPLCSAACHDEMFVRVTW